MVEHPVEPHSSVAGAAGRADVIEPSLRNALPHFLPLAIFPLVANAAIHGGWWIACPFVFFWLAGIFETTLGTDERNMDPEGTPDRQLLWYRLAVWTWAVLWPVTLVFSLWQILVVGHLAAWEIALMALVLATTAQAVFIVGHEMIHRLSAWERRFGEFLLSTVSYPHYATEHIYIHHALVGTPGDIGSAPKGQSFWSYFPREVASNLTESWRVQHTRLARRHLAVWHYTNPFWRYVVETAFWVGLLYWMGGAWAVPVFLALCLGVVFSMKLSNYIQHYGLRRIRLPSGKFERVQPWHSWSAARKLTNWLYFSMQRHSDHHTAADRRYPLMQHQGADKSPQLPGSYGRMFGLALFPRRWFETMDPLVDQWRERFYPQIDDWSAYDSPAFAARADSFEAIAEILGAAPRLGAWINRAPELLDSLEHREFTDLELPDGFGPDPEFEAVARRGLARLYWTHEYGVTAMKEEIADIPVQGVQEAVEIARNWSNGKVFQIGVHTMRGNLSPVEAGEALSNVARASIAAVLRAVDEEFTDPRFESGIAAVILGDVASGEVAPGADLDVMFVYDGGPARYCEALCRSFLAELRALSRDNLLFAPIPGDRQTRAAWPLTEFLEHHRTVGTAAELLDLTRARCIYASGDAGIGARFDETRREILIRGVARDALVAELREAAGGTDEPGPASIEGARGGLRDVERAARFLYMSHAEDASDVPAPSAASIYQAAAAHGLIPDRAAERLVQAASMWRNLRGVLRLVAENGFAVESADPRVEAVIARACGMDDFGALTDAVREAASGAAAEIDALDGMPPDRRQPRGFASA